MKWEISFKNLLTRPHAPLKKGLFGNLVHLLPYFQDRKDIRPQETFLTTLLKLKITEELVTILIYFQIFFGLKNI